MYILLMIALNIVVDLQASDMVKIPQTNESPSDDAEHLNKELLSVLSGADMAFQSQKNLVGDGDINHYEKRKSAIEGYIDLYNTSHDKKNLK